MLGQSGRMYMKHFWISLLVVIFLGPAAIYSHPHTFIDSRIEFEFNSKGMQGIWVDWLFDEMFSATIKLDYDTDKNNQFSSSEIQDIRQNAFSNLKEYDYFTFIRLNKRPIDVTSVQSFSALIEGSRLRYRFFIPLKVTSGKSENNLALVQFDQSFYVNIALQKTAPVVVNSTKNQHIAVSVQQSLSQIKGYNQEYLNTVKDAILFNDSIKPFEISLSFKEKN